MTSALFTRIDRYVDDSATLDPLMATSLGIGGHDHEMTDLSPDGVFARNQLRREASADLATIEREGPDDVLAAAYVEERFGTLQASYDVGEWAMALNPISAPHVGVRSAFDLMPRDGAPAWSNIASRLHLVGGALGGLQATFDAGLADGRRAARRQALAVAAQVRTWVDSRWFDTLVTEAEARTDVPPALVAELRAGAQSATEAYAGFARYLTEAYAPKAREHDGCGPELYRIGVRKFLGADLDPQEMYDWAWGEFDRLRAEMVVTCAEILPGASFSEVVDMLDHDPQRAVHGEANYRSWLQALTDEAIERSTAHFEIPEVMARCEALIPPAGSAAAAYYTGPSEDFSRPGRTWYPTLGREAFPMWGDVTTCYHESVPGHHLQIAYAKLQAQSLSRLQRVGFISGHGEGWALYAEQLCDEFGWFANPDHRLGFLCGQMLRTVRVIIDIGMHLGFRIPAGTTLADGTTFHGGEVWTPDLAFEFAVAETGSTEDFVRSEIDRYLGWPAQAISYKIGQREWETARTEAQARSGSAFDLRAWHTTALRLGPIGLDNLRSLLADA